MKGRCKFCGAVLRNPESIKLDYGPECAQKHGLYHPLLSSISIKNLKSPGQIPLIKEEEKINENDKNS